MTTTVRKTKLLSLLSLLLASAAPFGVEAQATAGTEVGRVVAASGVLTRVSADGTEYALKRRDPIARQDTIRVGDNGFIQIRFTDGALVTLPPGSELKVREYEFARGEDGSEKAVLGLIKGGLRTITGAIGRTNRENYQVETPVATIGIRGTHYGLRLCAQQSCGSDYADGLYGGVADGAIGVVNGGGDYTVGNDRYFYVASWESSPTELMAPPAIIFDYLGPQITKSSEEELRQAQRFSSAGGAADELAWLQTVQKPQEQPVYVESDLFEPKKHDDGGGGGETPTGNAAPDGSVTLVAFKGHDVSGNKLWVSDALVQQSGHPVQVESVNGQANVVTYVEPTVMNGCTDGCLLDSTDWLLAEQGSAASPDVSWGRWEESWLRGIATEDAGTPYAGWHFIHSNDITAAADLDALKAKGLYAYFDFAGGPLPTDQYGYTGEYVEGSPRLKVDFSTAEFIEYYVGVIFPEQDLAISGELAEPTPIGSNSTTLPLAVACSGCDTGTGSGHADVAFVGSEASHAMTSFTLHSDDEMASAMGVALLYQSSSGTVDTGGGDTGGGDNGGGDTGGGGDNGGGTTIQGTPAPAGLVVATAFGGRDAAGGLISVADHLVQGTDGPVYVDTVNGTAGVVTHIDATTLGGCTNCALDMGNATLAQSGGNGTPEVVWGRWAGSWGILESDVPATPAGDWHFIASADVTSMADLDQLRAQGIYAYFVPGTGTSPTDELGNVGSYDSYSPRMTVNFGDAQIVEYYVGVHFPTDLSFYGELANPVGFSSASSTLPLDVTCYGCEVRSGSGSADVVFLGSSAKHAMTAFEMQSGDSLHTATGVHLMVLGSSYSDTYSNPTTGLLAVGR